MELVKEETEIYSSRISFVKKKGRELDSEFNKEEGGITGFENCVVKQTF